MGSTIRLTASDGHQLEAYRADPDGAVRGGVVVIQEVFGLTDHIQRVTDGFAAEGFVAIAPAMFDRVEPGLQLDYSDVETGRETMLQLDQDQAVLDMQAALDALGTERRAVVGYCWGGAMADLAACELEIDAAVSYYGGRITSWLDSQPGCPVIYHFGAKDPLIPPEVVEQIRGARPEGEFHVYEEAGHGFNCDERPDFHPESAALALERSLAFLSRHLD